MDVAVPKGWTGELAVVVAAVLTEFYPQILDTPVALFAIGCFPWHGLMEMSMLTSEEVAADPMLIEPAEMAAWKHYNFAVNLVAWVPGESLARKMADIYRVAPARDRGTIVDAFIRACADAAASRAVSEVLDSFNRDSQFRVSVSHPDDGREFYPR